ncbi:alkylhydroperoxidase/carboxymuconolactone decarboxylase family protein [Variovorax sp. PBS-H4]|uniref:carboxymuconolactone decarboxylase family protein n=1 Tax=Variovorax sp. PBS-H4 TaxID=434008 RepID=UPI001316A5BD|nr:carboxymuconolactone decarboxylase family protein [Variovorax sp. PBS-H4]VTU33505.1 alkylhydroperoxidase/carboxymuconolactone decarboxylase family protein [Variovorax sp. PBS-H4]
MKKPDVMTDDARAQIKQSFIAERGYWRPWTQTMLQACPAFVQQYARYAGYPARTGPLTERMVELIYIALDSSSSHLFEPGLHTHMKRALEVGATQADIFDVLHLVAVQGLASVCQATDILAELTGSSADAVVDEALRARVDGLGPAHALALNSVARLDPRYAEVLLDFVEQGRPGGGLTTAERSLVQLALHSCFTAFNPHAIRQMLATALSQGLTAAELLQAIQLGAHLAVHGTALGTNVLREVQSSDIDSAHPER